MKRLPFIIAVFLILTLNISAENHLDPITFMNGEFAGSEYGNDMASLDFNGDGYIDLVIGSQAWNPAHVFADNQRFGKLYFYWGGPNFDNIPDFVIEGEAVGQYGSSYHGMDLFNAGDMNNDGIDDLVVKHYRRKAAVFFGRPNPQNTPDVVLDFPDPEDISITITPLGDINGDNRADLSILSHRSQSFKQYIWTDYLSQPWLFRQTINSQTSTQLSGIGDVNGDGFSDGFMHMPINDTGQTQNRLILYFGSYTFPQTDSLVICENTNSITTHWGNPVGDVDNDGTADFVAYDNHLWLGGRVLTADWNVTLSAVYHTLQFDFTEYLSGYPFVHGDLNGDGFEDIIGADPLAGYYHGMLYLWMGRSQMNGTMDFLLMGPDEYPNRNFGWSKVTGDFNADGLCDVAVGAPWGTTNDHIVPGRVYVYAGNTDLQDTTVSNEDDIADPAVQLKLSIYPNPAGSKEVELHFKIEGDSRTEVSQPVLCLFNVKGQLVSRRMLTTAELTDGKGILAKGKLRRGTYIAVLNDNQTRITSAKVTLY